MARKFLNLRRTLFLGLVLLGFGMGGLVAASRPAMACCNGCPPNVCPIVKQIIENYHEIYRDIITRYITNDEFKPYRTWWTTDFFEYSVLPGLMMITDQMSALTLHQSMMLGALTDAQQQLRTQRALQELQLAAYRDYQPSEGLCAIGTNVRSLADSGAHAKYAARAISTAQLQRQLRSAAMASAGMGEGDAKSHWEKFRSTYCDPHDANNRLEGVCARGNNPDLARTNIDIDFTRLIDSARTIPADFSGAGNPNAGGEDIIAIASNLYGQQPLTQNFSRLSDDEKAQWYLALRSIAAKRAVAENSFASIAGLKASVPPRAGESPKTQAHMGAVMKALGVPVDEINGLIGENPSHYAQMEILAQKLYQNPAFFAGLVDKPANVQRQGAALAAIDLMLDRSVYESELRQEMTLSVLLSSALNKRAQNVRRNLPQTTPQASAQGGSP